MQGSLEVSQQILHYGVLLCSISKQLPATIWGLKHSHVTEEELHQINGK